MQGIIDVGYVGDMVARLFLLLAMDTAIMGGDKLRHYTLQGGGKRFEGQFCSVSLLLSMLDGSIGTDASVEVFRVTMEFPDEKSGGTSDAAGASGSATGSGRVSAESGAQVQGNTTGTANLSRESSHQRKREPSKQQPGRSSKKQKANAANKEEKQTPPMRKGQKEKANMTGEQDAQRTEKAKDQNEENAHV
ncbi:hypothetical protein PR003_g29890 [Phytophthora rubi]|uniref:Uncharacterized protein n=1 Tax=Phytophthora rubi TaxID=129364 RepID=A0A6A4BE62_9STRA|nr:hypothetical protein PR002_g28238 [Phytophthora rubi]KAE9273501.1 hypothetical protein PR003_g29890 [Phytophthora rubi]